MISGSLLIVQKIGSVMVTTKESKKSYFDSTSTKENVNALTKEELLFIEEEYKSCVLSPREAWRLRDKKHKNAYEKKLVYHDNLVIEELRLEKMKALGIEDLVSRYRLGQRLKKENPSDPYGDIPQCEALRPGGDPREDIFCLTQEERAMMKGNKYSYLPAEHPELNFLTFFTEEKSPPNSTALYYSNYNAKGVPKTTAKKYTARFYGEFDKEPFTELSLHKYKGTSKERKIVDPSLFAKKVLKHKKIEAKNREKVVAEKNKGGTKFFDGIDQLELDKPRTRKDGTDTFRGIIAIHDAPHSVALQEHENEKERFREKEEKERQFALHNIVPLSFPWGLEYIKYYTQGDGKSDIIENFPLVVTSLMISAEEMLEKNGLPKAMARWCTNQYKLFPSDFFFKTFEMDGITQRVGMTRYQGRGRFHMKPYTTIWEKTAKTNTVKIKGDKNSFDKSTLATYDEDGYPIDDYETKYDDKKQLWTVKYRGANPKMRIYQNLPIFDTTEEEQIEKMVQHNLKLNPLIDKFDFHGCLLCPHRSSKYFQSLKERNEELYKIADSMRKAGSKRNIERGKDEYYYFYQPYKKDKKTGELIHTSMEEAYEKKPENFTTDEEGNLRPII